MNVLKALLRTTLHVVLIAVSAFVTQAQIPTQYRGTPFFDDSLGFKGPHVIPGRVELAYYDFGGEGIASSGVGVAGGGGGQGGCAAQSAGQSRSAGGGDSGAPAKPARGLAGRS